MLLIDAEGDIVKLYSIIIVSVCRVKPPYMKIDCISYFKKNTVLRKKNMNSLNVEYFLAMNIQNLDKNG